MKNCLVTKLKSSVDNENLVTMDEFLLVHEQVNVPGEISYNYILLNGSYLDAKAKLRLLGNKVMSDTGLSYREFNYSGGDGALPAGANIPDGEYNFIVENKYKLTGMQLPINVIFDCNAIKYLNLFNITLYSRHHKGSILDFGRMTNLVRFIFFYNKTISGELSTLFAAMAANGKTTTLHVEPNSVVTYNGASVSNKILKVSFNDGTYSVSITDK